MRFSANPALHLTLDDRRSNILFATHHITCPHLNCRNKVTVLVQRIISNSITVLALSVNMVMKWLATCDVFQKTPYVETNLLMITKLFLENSERILNNIIRNFDAVAGRAIKCHATKNSTGIHRKQICLTNRDFGLSQH